MKMTNRSFSALFAAILVVIMGQAALGQAKTYKQMSEAEQNAFVNEQSRRIAQELSNRDYEFTPEFTIVIQRAVDSYARRVGNNRDDRLSKGDARFIVKRGQQYAPTLISTFKAHNLSPLFGLYIPMIESAFVNIQTPNMAGALGLFQFVPQTGKRYGLTPEELLNVEKSADAAARYITDSLELFASDPMKETLALLAYNRGGKSVTADLASVLTDQNRGCSICALTAASGKLDPTFQAESVYYVPLFFAAAIVGENPSVFGLQSQPLSSYATP